MIAKKVNVMGHAFYSGVTECLSCGKEVKFTIPRAALVYWEQTCNECNLNFEGLIWDEYGPIMVALLEEITDGLR